MSYGQLVQDVGGLSLPTYDYVDISPSATPTDGTTPQVYTFKNGGASGNTVCTLSIVYDVSLNVVSITKI